MAKLSKDEVRAIIIREIDNSLGLDGTKLTISRRDALKYYEGQPFGNEMAGRSQVISRDVMEAVEWSLPALLRIFMAGDDVVKFEPQGPEDEQAAKQATEYVNFIFQRDNPGFQITYNWFKDALLSKNGFIKSYWDKRTKITTERYSGLTQMEYEALKTPQSEDEEIEIIEENEHQMASAGGPGGAMPASPALGVASPLMGAPSIAPPLYDCVLKRIRKEGRVVVECVPPEEILITRRAVSIENASFVAHRTMKTRSELKEMGFDAKTVDDIPVEDEQEYNTERVQRFLPEEEFPFSPLRTDAPGQAVWLVEAYIKIDEDGDGIAELRKITTAGSRAQIILDDEEVDDVPFVSITPMPMPHKFFGMSLADLVMDLQLIKSTIWRQALDNLYLTNMPRHGVIDAPGYATTNTIDDLLLSRPGGIVRMANKDAVFALETPFVADKTFPMLDYLDETKETRTGVSKRNQGISPDDLNKTAAGMSMLQQAAAQRVELIARVFAETGMKELFRKILGLVTKYQDKARVIKLRNNWVPMDPRNWRNSFDLSVTVGLGTGNKDQMLTHLTNLGNAYAATIKAQGGVNGPVLTWKHVHKFLETTVQNMGFKNAEEWVQDPQNAPAQPPQPNPEMMKAQADMALKDKEIQGKKDLAIMEAQIEAALSERKMKHEQMLADQESQHRIALEQMQARMDILTQQMKAEFEMKLKAMEHGMKVHELNTKHIGDKLGAALQEGKITYDPPPPKEPEKPDPMIELGGSIKELLAHIAKPKRVTHVRGKDGRIAESVAE